MATWDDRAAALLAAVSAAMGEYADYTGRSAVSDRDLLAVLEGMAEEGILMAPPAEVMARLVAADEEPDVFGASDREREYAYFTFRDQVTDAVMGVDLYRPYDEREED